MATLLFLVHRIPYPPNKGDKIRSFNLLKHLAADYRILLGAFVDDPADWHHEAVLREICAEVCLVGIRPGTRRLRSLTGLVTGKALSLPYFGHRRMRAWVREKLRGGGVERVLVYSSPMAQYVLDREPGGMRRVVDFVDVDADKWRQYAARHRWPMNWIYAREARKLLAYDRRVALACDVSVFVSRDEAELFCRLVPEAAPRVTHVENGVDTEYFTPGAPYPDPYPAGERALVFTGAMDYWANVDAVTWFAEEVFPAVRARQPQARFYIVGARPTEQVRRLAGLPGVNVTGAVKDIRPYLRHAAAAVAPLRVARGLQNKVFEALAMGKPVLATRAALNGMRIGAEFDRLVSDDAAVLARLGIELTTEGDRNGIGARGRELVLREYAWSHHLRRFEALLQGGDGRPYGG